MTIDERQKRIERLASPVFLKRLERALKPRRGSHRRLAKEYGIGHTTVSKAAGGNRSRLIGRVRKSFNEMLLHIEIGLVP